MEISEIWKENMIKEFGYLLKKGDIIGHDGVEPWYIFNGSDKLYELINGESISDRHAGNMIREDMSFYRMYHVGNIVDGKIIPEKYVKNILASL